MEMDRINTLEKEIADMRKTLRKKEKELYDLKKEWVQYTINRELDTQQCVKQDKVHRIPKWAIERYSRQILLPEINAEGQERLMTARVLVVGAGGLGCPAALYLAGAGVGEIGIVDYDRVDMTNIHRQILHGEADQHMNKADSAAEALRNINSRITVTPYNLQLDSSNAMEIISKYDLVLDCSDNVPTRYLLSDACVLNKLPLIAGSALKFDGQLTVYGYRANKNTNEKEQGYIGPCYRCVFASPPPPEAVGSCSAHGVAGPVPGVIGALQALEAIKLIVGHTHEKLLVERMLLADGEDMTFRTAKLRPRNPECKACSNSPSITKLLDYEGFCRAQAKEMDIDLHILPPENRISPKQLAEKLNATQRHLLVDVRSTQEFNMCYIDGAKNCPIDSFREKHILDLVNEVNSGNEVTFICRRGNDSQIAAKQLMDSLDEKLKIKVKDSFGGLHAWSKDVDSSFPVY